MSIQLNTTGKVTGLEKTHTTAAHIVSASGYTTKSSIINLAGPSSGDKTDKKPFYKAWFSSFTSFFSKIFGSIKGFFCGKKTETPPPPKTDLELVKDFAAKLATLPADTFAAEFAKLPAAQQTGIKEQIWRDASRPMGDPAFGDKKLANYATVPADQGSVKGAFTNYIARQERIAPLVEFSKVVEGSGTGDEVVAALATLTARVNVDGSEDTIAEKLKYEFFVKCGSTDRGEGMNFAVNEMKRDPHGANLKAAVKSLTEKM